VIPLQFVLFWAGGKLSYLRYLTFKSLRHFHPEEKIELYISHNFDKSIHNWGCEKQDFETENIQKDYIDELPKINVEVKHVDYIGSPKICPVLQADLFRWMWMKQEGGIYLDTDQIILKSFESLPLEKEFIYCRYIEAQCGDYIPTGVLGLEKNSPIADITLKHTINSYNPHNYNSSGPFMMRNAIKEMDLTRSFNAPFQYFYPINSSKDVWKIYEGCFSQYKETLSAHWFGGHPLSQEFNKNYTEDFAKISKDSISKILRENEII
jgi:hypothetical protein